MKAPLACLTGLLFTGSLLLAGSPAVDIALPAPHKTGGMPLMQALALRSTSRAFSTKELSTQQLSDLLWAAFGVNRPDGRRTAPSAKNWQETDLYVLTKSGAYRYDAAQHRLLPVLAEDIRVLGGLQPFVANAPLTLVFVADMTRTGGADPAQHELAAMDVGFISQNVYLCCASEGLVTGARAYIDTAALGAKLGLRRSQVILLAQSVGYPAAG